MLSLHHNLIGVDDEAGSQKSIIHQWVCCHCIQETEVGKQVPEREGVKKKEENSKEAALESPWHVRYKVRRTDEQCDRYKEQDKSWTPSLKDLNSQVYRI